MGVGAAWGGCTSLLLHVRGPLHVVCLHGLACASLQCGGLRVVILLTQWLMALTQDPANQVEYDHLLRPRLESHNVTSAILY